METVAINLGRDEALLLFDLLSTWRDKERNLLFSNDGQRHAMLGLLATLEGVLVEPFKPEYGELVEKAGKNLMEKYGQL